MWQHLKSAGSGSIQSLSEVAASKSLLEVAACKVCWQWQQVKSVSGMAACDKSVFGRAAYEKSVSGMAAHKMTNEHQRDSFV